MKVNQNNNSIAESNLVLSTPKLSKLQQLLSLLPFFGKGKEKIAVLRLDGVIGKPSANKSGINLNSLNELIEKAFKTDKLKAVFLAVNSPGGSPVQSELIASRIIELSKEKDIPVYSFVEDVAASGGYWLACAGEKIFASRSSIIGSIGVISSSFGFQEAIKKLGIERRVYTQGNNKSVMDPFKEIKEEDLKIIKSLQKEIHEHFIDYVKDRRAGRLTQNDDILFNGEFWSGQSAVDFGLIDGIINMHSFIQKKFGKNIHIEYIEPKQSWFKKKFGINAYSKQIAGDFADEIIDKAEAKIDTSRYDFK